MKAEGQARCVLQVRAQVFAVWGEFRFWYLAMGVAFNTNFVFSVFAPPIRALEPTLPSLAWLAVGLG